MDQVPGRRRPRGKRLARGATLVEYAVVVSLFVLATVGGANTLSCMAAVKARDMEAGVAVREPILPDPTATTVPTSAPPTSAAPTTTPTTAATTTSTTAATTTSTTAPTTTSTAAPTTTAPPPGSPQGSLSGTTGARGGWWDGWGRRGDWVATYSLSFAYPRLAYLDIEVTRTLANGTTVTHTHPAFYVPGNGTATFELWENPYGATTAPTDVVQVRFRVTSIRTYDANWQEVTYPASGPSGVVNAPAPPR